MMKMMAMWLWDDDKIHNSRKHNTWCILWIRNNLLDCEKNQKKINYSELLWLVVTDFFPPHNQPTFPPDVKDMKNERQIKISTEARMLLALVKYREGFDTYSDVVIGKFSKPQLTSKKLKKLKKTKTQKELLENLLIEYKKKGLPSRTAKAKQLMKEEIV